MCLSSGHYASFDALHFAACTGVWLHLRLTSCSQHQVLMLLQVDYLEAARQALLQHVDKPAGEGIGYIYLHTVDGNSGYLVQLYHIGWVCWC